MFIEQVMIFALGFLFAGLLTLLFLPAFWRRAMTLSRRQLEMQMPLSMTEIVAERDQLRAEFAADQRRLEQKLEGARAERARDRIELGQRTIEVVSLREGMAALRSELAQTSRLLESAARSIGITEAELAAVSKQLYDVDGALARRSAALAGLNTIRDALVIQCDEQRMAIAGLEIRLSGREADIEDLQRDLSYTKIDVSEARSALDLLTIERDQFRFDARNATTRRDALQLEFETQTRRLEDLQSQIRTLEKEKIRLAGDRESSAGLLEEERRRVSELSARLAGHDGALKSLEDMAALANERARASQTAAEGSLDAQRRENELLRSEINGLRSQLRRQNTAGQGEPDAKHPADADFSALRMAISTIGQDIARVAAELEHAKSPPEKPQQNERSRVEPARTDAAE